MKPSVWIVDDNPRSLQEIREALRNLDLEVSELRTQDEFVTALSELQTYRARPDVVVLDLHLPWDGLSKQDSAAELGGIGCLALLRQEEATRDVAVVVYSAFVEGDALIRGRLAQFSGVTLVSKPEKERLRTVVENLLPYASTRTVWRLLRAGQSGERNLLRLAAIIGAVTVVVGAVLYLLRLF